MRGGEQYFTREPHARSRPTTVHVKLRDGRPYNNRYAWSIEVRDGRIFAIREYMDSHYVATLFSGGA